MECWSYRYPEYIPPASSLPSTCRVPGLSVAIDTAWLLWITVTVLKLAPCVLLWGHLVGGEGITNVSLWGHLVGVAGITSGTLGTSSGQG